MTISTPLKKGDYQIIDDVRIDYTNALGDLDGSTIIDPKEYDTTQVAVRQYQNNLEEKPSAGAWFNLAETEGATGVYKNSKYWTITKDVVFYLIQAGTTKGIIWTFMVAPMQVTITKNMDYTAEPNWGSNERTITYGGTAMRKISLGEILIDGLATRTSITKKINNLEKLLDPVQYQKHIAPLVFELVVKPKGGLSSESRSFGYYIITDLSEQEVLRDHNGRPLRVIASLELQEVPSYQINDGRDLTLPKNLIVKVDKTAKEKLEDGSTNKDFRPGTTREDITYKDSNGKVQKGTKVTQRKIINGYNQEVTWIEDANGRQVGKRSVRRLGKASSNAVSKTQTTTAVKSKYTQTVNTAPKEQ